MNFLEKNLKRKIIKKISVITGGTGFIGFNLAESLLRKGERVVVLDNLSRLGNEKNLTWLTNKFNRKFNFSQTDIRNFRFSRV